MNDYTNPVMVKKGGKNDPMTTHLTTQFSSESSANESLIIHLQSTSKFHQLFFVPHPSMEFLPGHISGLYDLRICAIFTTDLFINFFLT